MPTAKNIILFGASLGGESYIQHHPELNIIAIADNDSSRWGQELLGKPIINPAAIPGLVFEQIIITSLWSDAIKHQLVHELGIAASKVVVPPKNAVKPISYPFLHPATLAVAQNSLIQLTEFLHQHGIQAIVDSGTALGLVRDGDLIPWDDDIDLAIDAADFEQLIQLTPGLVAALPQAPNSQWHAVLIKQAGEPVCINLDLVSQDQNQLKDIEISLQKRLQRNGRSELVSSAGIFDAPAVHFHNPVKTNYQTGYVFLPNQVEDFLEFMYGNWREPAKNTNFENYHNREKQQQTDARSVQITKEDLL